jgi:hypothetical protein
VLVLFPFFAATGDVLVLLFFFLAFADDVLVLFIWFPVDVVLGNARKTILVWHRVTDWHKTSFS